MENSPVGIVEWGKKSRDVTICVKHAKQIVYFQPGHMSVYKCIGKNSGKIHNKGTIILAFEEEWMELAGFCQ